MKDIKFGFQQLDGALKEPAYKRKDAQVVKVIEVLGMAWSYYTGNGNITHNIEEAKLFNYPEAKELCERLNKKDCIYAEPFTYENNIDEYYKIN